MANKKKLKLVKSGAEINSVTKDFKFCPLILAEKKGTLTLTENLQQQIDDFHQYVGNKEWSGILLFTIDEGDTFGNEELKISAKALYPMDIGSETYTEYELEKTITDVFDIYPQILEENWRMGLIH